MTQLTQGSDMELEKYLRLNCPASCDGNGTYAEDDGNGNPEPAQCQWCYEVGMPLRAAIQADKQRSIDRAIAEARIDELKHIDDPINVNVYFEGLKPVFDRIAELEQQLSPTTTEDKEVK